jgi:hypothetical protein
MAIAIEAYGAEGAIALVDRYPLQFIDALVDLTCTHRSDPEDIEIEEKYERLEEKIFAEPNRELVFASPTGESKNIKLSDFFIDF